MIDRVKKNRLLRSTIRPVWKYAEYAKAQGLRLLSRKTTSLCPVERISPRNAHYFFGYYDKCPWDTTGRYMLCLKTPFARRMPRQGEAASICVIDLENDNQMREIARTTAWCWQQGCMLQWIGDGSEQRILYNDFRNGHYVTVICHRDGETIKILSRPTYALRRDGKKVLSLNFSRLHYCRPGYGYVAEPFVDRSGLRPEDDGIFLVDIDSGKSQLVISLDQITKINPRKEFAKSTHYFNHIEFNPGGSRFVFYHRWRSHATSVEKTRMYTCAPDGSELYCLSDHDMVSHYTWKDDNHLLAWAAHPLAGQHYYLYEDKTNRVTVVGDGVLTEDGHPSYDPDGRWIVTDTYPDLKRHRTLLLFDTSTGKRYDIGKYFVPLLFEGTVRCDLHPRWSRDGQKVCFDSVHEGKRRMYNMDVSSILA